MSRAKAARLLERLAAGPIDARSVQGAAANRLMREGLAVEVTQFSRQGPSRCVLAITAAGRAARDARQGATP